jgi:hypothetical protein
MNKPLSKKEREDLRGFIGGAIIRMSRGSEKEFETLYSKLEALHLDVVPDLDLLAYALAAGLNGGYDFEFVERMLTGLWGLDSRDFADAQAYTKERFPDGKFL